MMSESTTGARRSPEAIDSDFADLMASKLPVAVARDKFERLWDEANAIAAQLVLTPEGPRYVSLLKRMHQMFESQYSLRGPINGHESKRSRS
jgi:hypothetical protein